MKKSSFQAITVTLAAGILVNEKISNLPEFVLNVNSEGVSLQNDFAQTACEHLDQVHVEGETFLPVPYYQSAPQSGVWNFPNKTKELAFYEASLAHGALVAILQN